MQTHLSVELFLVFVHPRFVLFANGEGALEWCNAISQKEESTIGCYSLLSLQLAAACE